MSNIVLPAVLTPDEVAEYLKSDKGTVEREFNAGRLRGFKAGEEWRTTDSSLLEYINGNSHSQQVKGSESMATPYKSTGFNKIEPFDYKWPSNTEDFDSGYEATVTVNGRVHTFRIGFTDREAAGQMRRRIVVWMDNWPIVEFASGNNYEFDKLYASVIKVGGRQVRPSEAIPSEYKGFHVDTYDSVVQGPYASRNMAIIVTEDDLASMLKHAIIRAGDKEFI